MPTIRHTRRSVSFRAEFFERLRRYCKSEGAAMSACIEEEMTALMDAAGIPKVSRDEAVRIHLRLEDRRPVTW